MGEGTYVKPTIEMPEDWQSPSERRSPPPAPPRAEPAAPTGGIWGTEVPPLSPARAQVRGRAGVDWLLVGVVAGLVLFGLVMVYSSSVKFSAEIEQPVYYFLLRQSLWAGLGALVATLLAFINYHYIRVFGVWIMLGTLVLLLAVATFGDTTYGAIRSLAEGSIRPSELAKLVTILYVSVWLNAKRDVLNEISLGLIPLMAILGLTGGLILVQPDLSAALTVLILGCLLFFLSGGEWRQIALVLLVAVVLGWGIVNVYPTGVDRITRYLAGLNNPLEASYHVQRALEAVINGGLFGVGIGHGSTKFTGLPVALTDSIFAVITEELGLLGAGVMISAYLIILWRGLSIARRAEDHLGALIAGGITIWIALEALINMAVMVNLLPHAGNALPFISYGGTHLLVTLAGVGILINIARTSGRSEKTGGTRGGGNPFGAVIDLRWRDRGRRVSRPGRSAGTR